MTIGRAQTPFVTLSVQGKITNIKEYFEEKKKQNIRLVVVIIPNLNNAYSKSYDNNWVCRRDVYENASMF